MRENTKEVIDDFMGFCGEEVLLGHNILFDYKFMKRYACKYQHSFERRGIDTLKIARKVHKDLESRSLEALCAHYQIKNDAAHWQYHDALQQQNYITAWGTILRKRNQIYLCRNYFSINREKNSRRQRSKNGIWKSCAAGIGLRFRRIWKL